MKILLVLNFENLCLISLSNYFKLIKQIAKKSLFTLIYDKLYFHLSFLILNLLFQIKFL